MSTDQDVNKDKRPPTGGLTASYDDSLVKVLLYSLAAGLVIVLYVLIIVRVEKTRTKIDPVDRACMIAAEEMTRTVVSHPRFGLIGLDDNRLEENTSYGMEPSPVRSLNSINASIKVAADFASKIDSSLMTDLIDQDLDVLSDLEASLYTKLADSLKETNTEEGNPAYEKAYQALRSALPNNINIKSLKLTMGGYGKSSGRQTSIKAPETGASRATYAENGFYRENIPVPVTTSHSVRFYKTYELSKSVPPEKFVLKSEGMLPAAVLLEATLEDSHDGSQKEKSACALIGSPSEAASASCLVLRFPQGMPVSSNKLSFFFQTEIQPENSEGYWGQALDGSVPGKGHLSPTIDPVLTPMKPDQAIVCSLYNWLKNIAPAPSLEQLDKLMEADFASAYSREKLTRFNYVNSCLAIDTGARQRAFLNATMPGYNGQHALANCFEYPNQSSVFPSSALPVVIDREGRALLSGRADFDEELVNSYLDSLYSTNLAALETMATARRLSRKYQAIADDKRVKLARTAGRNALNIAEKSFEIAERSFALLGNGLHKIDRSEAYLVGRQFVFLPAERPLTEDDLLKQDSSLIWTRKDASTSASVLIPWKDYFHGTGGVTVEGKPLDLVLAENLKPPCTGPLTVVFDSRDLQSGGAVIPHLSRTYPFEAHPITEGQSAYYCVNGLKTGSKPEVCWSILIRDNAFHKNTATSGNRYPLKNRHQWHREFEPPFASCPQLSFEIQIRRPLPRVDSVPRSTLVTDPRFDRKSPVVPPIPAEMM